AATAAHRAKSDTETIVNIVVNSLMRKNEGSGYAPQGGAVAAQRLI
ncbi:hypothetical protein, partial [Salinibacter phage 6_12]